MGTYINNTFWRACLVGDLEAVKQSRLTDPEFDTYKSNALTRAAFHNHPDIVQFLITCGADRTAYQYEALRGAMSRGFIAVVEEILEAKKEHWGFCQHQTLLHIPGGQKFLELVGLVSDLEKGTN
jgi:ankyrin repeat protein